MPILSRAVISDKILIKFAKLDKGWYASLYMRKEVILAIVAGSVLGLVIAFGIWRANLSFSPRKGSVTNPTSIPSSPSDFKITLAKPQSYQVISLTPTIISGVTRESSYVVVSAEDQDYVTKSDNNGQFEIETDLNGGVNQIRVAAFDDSGASAQTNLLLVYSSEYAKDQDTSATTDQNSTPSADSIRQKVQEKLSQVESNPIATLGTITDLTDNTIQIKTQAGEIQLVSLDKINTTFIKTTKDVIKEIKFSDLAIGDFIVAMGTKNGNGILQAKRVLITDPLKETTRNVVFGQVLVTDKLTKLTLKNPKDGKTYSIEPDDQIKIIDLVNAKGPATRFSHIDQGDTIIAVGSSSDDTFTARTIILVKNAPTSSPTATPKQ